MAAARKLTETNDGDILECGICLDRFQTPRALPCLHSFCQECLVKYCDGRKLVLCPKCKNVTTVPDEGVSGFPASIMMEIGDNTPCSNCDQPNKSATVYCLVCKEFYCDVCHTSHDALKKMKQQKVVSVEDIRSGKIVLPRKSSQDQMCEDHEDETKKFHCESCEQLVCRDCIILDHRQHQYSSLKDAAKKRASILVELSRQSKNLQRKYQDAIQETKKVEVNLTNALKEVRKELKVIKNEYHRQVDAIFSEHEAKVHSIEEQRTTELGLIKEELQTVLEKVANACDLTSKVTQAGSDYDIISIYHTLSARLEEINKSNEPVAADEALGCLGIQVFTKIEVPDVVSVKRGEGWEQTGQFCTEPLRPYGIAIHPYGDIAVTGWWSEYAKIFSKQGNLKYTFKGSFNAYQLSDIAITPDNRYILPGKAKILFYDSQGNQLKSSDATTSDVNNKPRDPRTLAVDSTGRIIAGLSKSKTISIHQSDGRLISKFAAPAEPRRLAVTCKGDIAVTLENDTLQLMDYSGNNTRVVQPPQGFTEWDPWFVCCSVLGDIFVLNRGYHRAVYRYTADGDQCLGCVISGLDNPWDIAITEDGQHMFVSEFSQYSVKIFHR